MKKFIRSIVIALMLLCTLSLVACKDPEPDKLTDQDVVNAAKESFTINVTEATQNFTLPTTAVGGVTVSWASNDAAIVISGQNATVTRPAYEDGNKSVTLTATLAKGDASATKNFTVIVICLEDVQKIEALTVAEAIATDQGETVTVRGIVSGFHYGKYKDELSIQACYITDETGTVYVYGYQVAQEVEKGDDVVLEATIGQYNGYTQLTSPVLVQTVSKGNDIPTEGAKTDKTIADISADLAGNYTAAAYIFEGVQIKKIVGSDYINYAVEDKTGKAINIYSSADSVEFEWLEEYLGKELKVLFAVNSQNSKGTKWRGHVLDVLEVIGDWGGGSTSGTKATVTEILAAAANLEHQAKLEGNYEATGTVTSIVTAYDASFGNVTFMLSDGTNEIECYRTNGTSAASVQVGDTVTVVGEVQKYNEKIEFAYATITARTAGEGGGNQGGNEGGNEGGNTGTGETGSATAPLTVAQALAAGQGTKLFVKGVVSGFHYSTSVQGFYITDNTGTVYVFGNQVAATVNVGDEIIFEAELGQHNGFVQLTYPTLSSTVSTGNTISIEGAVTDKTVAQIAANLSGNFAGAAYIFEGVQIKKIDGGSYINYVLEDKAGNAINLYSSGNSSEFAVFDEYANKELKVLFAINSQNSNKNKWRGHVLEVLEVIGDWTTGGNEGGNEGGNTGGNEGGNEGGNTGTTGLITSPVAGTAYKMAMTISGGKVVYLTGEMSGYYGATTENATSGADVFFEEVSGGYNLYFMKGGVKTYIVITISGTHFNITFQASAGYVWTWDTTYNTDGTKVFLGTHGTFNTFGGSNYDSYIATSYPANFYGEGGGNTGGNEGGNEGGNTGGNEGGNETSESTVSEVLSATAGLAEGATSTTIYTTTGVITGINAAYDAQYGNVSFYLSDGTKEILVYRATGAEAANVKKGDTVTVVGKVKNYFKTFEFVEVEITARTPGAEVEEEVADVVISFNDVANRTTFTTSQQVWAQNGITVTNNKTSSSNEIVDYANPARFYKNSSLTVAYSSNITKIVIYTDGGKCYTGSETISGATLSVAGGVMTIELTTPATSFTISTLATQVRATKIEIFTAK